MLKIIAIIVFLAAALFGESSTDSRPKKEILRKDMKDCIEKVKPVLQRSYTMEQGCDSKIETQGYDAFSDCLLKSHSIITQNADWQKCEQLKKSLTPSQQRLAEGYAVKTKLNLF